jgi:hypothetical protein
MCRRIQHHFLREDSLRFSLPRPYFGTFAAARRVYHHFFVAENRRNSRRLLAEEGFRSSTTYAPLTGFQARAFLLATSRTMPTGLPDNA